MPVIVGLTGQSGSGKGLFCSICTETDGVFALDTDLVARKVVEKGQPALEELAEYFGKEILMEDGSLNRPLLARIAFSNQEKHLKLNSITHFHIMKYVREWLDTMREKGAKMAIIDAPLLFESGAHELCDVTVAVIAPYSVRLERIMERDGIDEKSARIRLDSQPGDDFFEEKCDYVIVNLSDKEDFRSRAERLIGHILKQV